MTGIISGKDTAGSEDQQGFYIHDDTLQRTAPWIIRDYKELGALSEAQKAEIAAQFDLEPEIVQELSVLVGNSLDTSSVVSLVKVSRRTAVSRGRKRLEEAARLARRMNADHAAIQNHLSGLSTEFDAAQLAAPLLAALRDNLAAIGPTVTDLEGWIDELAGIDHGLASIEPDDKRRARDMRREHVVRSCCYIWEDAGRIVGYTTVSHEPGAPQRRGTLIDLVNTVIRLVTDPPTGLSGETLRRDIDRFKKLRSLGRI